MTTPKLKPSEMLESIIDRNNKYETLQSDFGWLIARVRKLEKALEFYADASGKDDYYSGHWIECADDWSDPMDRFHMDKGNKARTALQEDGEGEK